MKQEEKKKIEVLDTGVDLVSEDGTAWPCCSGILIPIW